MAWLGAAGQGEGSYDQGNACMRAGGMWLVIFIASAVVWLVLGVWLWEVLQ
jgi:hypothetical protein